MEPPLPARDPGTGHPAVRGRGGEELLRLREVAAFVNDKWNRGSVNHSAQFFTWKERKEYSADDEKAALEMYEYEQQQGTASQPVSDNAFLKGNAYHAPDRSRFSGMNVIDMRMHMNFGDADNAFHNGKDLTTVTTTPPTTWSTSTAMTTGPTRAASGTRAARTHGRRTCR